MTLVNCTATNQVVVSSYVDRTLGALTYERLALAVRLFARLDLCGYYHPYRERLVNDQNPCRLALLLQGTAVVLSDECLHRGIAPLMTPLGS